MSDIDFLQKEYDKVKEEALSYSDKDINTKKDFILRLKEKALMLFEAEKKDISKLASFIWNDLTNYGFSIAKSHYFSLFTEEEKGNYLKSSVTEHFHKFEKEGNIEKCNCGLIKYDGLLYDVVPEKEEDKTEKLPEPKTPLKETDVTEYLIRIKQNFGRGATIAEKLLSKYYHYDDVAKIIDESLPEIELENREQIEIEAEMMNILKQIDMRQRIGRFQKIKSILLEKCKYNIAHVAKLLSPPCVKCGHQGITAKHMSANIMRKDRDDVLKPLQWFRSIEFEDSHGNEIVVDIADWFNRQCERGELNLDIEKPYFVRYEAK